MIILFIVCLINIIIFDFSFESRNEKRKVVPKLRQEVKVDIVTSDDINIYYIGKFQEFTARYIITKSNVLENRTDICRAEKSAQADLCRNFNELKTTCAAA